MDGKNVRPTSWVDFTIVYMDKNPDRNYNKTYYSLLYLIEEREIIRVIIPLIVNSGW